MNDTELLRRFAADGCPEAFRELVGRHTDFVYSCACQRLHDPHAAQDVTQAVFLALAQQTHKLSLTVPLPGWLYQVTRYTCAMHQRRETRRKQREMKAVNHLDQTAPDAASAAWDQLQPHLCAALDDLPALDRHAVLLRFYRQESYRDVAAALRTSEDSARKRVERALEKLRRFFSRKGVMLSAAALAGALSTTAVQAAPAGLAASSAGLALGGTLAATSSTLLLAKGALHAMFIAKLQSTAVIATACVVVAGTSVVVAQRAAAPAAPISPPAAIQTRDSGHLMREGLHLSHGDAATAFALIANYPPAQRPDVIAGLIQGWPRADKDRLMAWLNGLEVDRKAELLALAQRKWPAQPPPAAAIGEIAFAVQARVVRAAQAQPDAYAAPEAWIVEKVQALPVNTAAGHRPPAFVEVVSPWHPLAWTQPTAIEAQHLRTTLQLVYREPNVSLTGMLESGDARGHLPSISLLAKPGATAVVKLTSTGYYLAVQAVNAPPQPAPAVPQVSPAAATHTSRGRIAALEPDQLTLHVLRGPSGIMRPVALTAQTAVMLANGQRGTLADLKVDQWIQVTLTADWKTALKIEPSTPPWEGAATPAEYKDAEVLLGRWLAAIEANDLAAHQQCLHFEARQVNEYGTAQALAFWSKQIKDLRKDGFRGQWQFQKPAVENQRFPAGSVQAHPVMEGEPSSEYILLVPENGQWVIARLFS